MSLTDRQRQVLRLIDDSIRERGYPPTMRELAPHLGDQSLNSVHEHIDRLIKRGMLERTPFRSRGLRLTDAARAELGTGPRRPRDGFVLRGVSYTSVPFRSLCDDAAPWTRLALRDGAEDGVRRHRLENREHLLE